MKQARTFSEASKVIEQNLQKHLSKYDGFQEDSDDDECDDELSNQLLEKILESYSVKDGDALISAKDTLRSAFQSTTCLICIDSLKKADKIWSCATCFVSFHVSCVQKWAKDSIFQQKQLLEQEEANSSSIRETPSSTKTINWSCPKCRSPYKSGQIPTKYTCYCEKVVEPAFDPWIVPHSCGEKCGRPLSTGCSHKCIILCHPGPCPPCPQTVRVSCYCGKSAPSVKRCSASSWSCKEACGLQLACGIHTCKDPCHPGECSPCPRTSVQTCICERAKEHRACSSPKWKCGTLCGKLLSCGHHSCEVICHPKGVCPPCPLSLARHCPCGKKRDFMLSCTEATPCCGDTCGKELSCGNHLCAERCHRGHCPNCLQLAVKSCRCGAKKKEIQCAKNFTCDVKCKRIRDCRKHYCNKKCCDQCQPCEQSCGKTLNCKNHKCMSRCHQGPCFPCPKQVEMACTCGSTRLLVPCGREKTMKPPKCKKDCMAPSNCHHPERRRHNCHAGPCPSCKEVCGQDMECGHVCPAPCHDNVQVKIEDNTRPAGPWEERGPIYKIQKLACPPCAEPVPIACLGKHEIADWPCHVAKSSSCGRLCGRLLACTNHTCERECHKVKHAPDIEVAGTNCAKCNRGCEKERMPGCTHSCVEACHPGSCALCEVNIKMKCHCGINNLYVKCNELTKADEDRRTVLLCCNDQCPKVLSCGHRCIKTCHTGTCSTLSECKKKVKLHCPCKRQKEEYRCFNVNSTDVAVVCNEECREMKRLADSKKRGSAGTKEGTTETELDRKEAEIFEKRLEGGKRRRRNRRTECTEDEAVGGNRRTVLMGSILVCVIGIVLYAYFVQM